MEQTFTPTAPLPLDALPDAQPAYTVDVPCLSQALIGLPSGGPGRQSEARRLVLTMLLGTTRPGVTDADTARALVHAVGGDPMRAVAELQAWERVVQSHLGRITRELHAHLSNELADEQRHAWGRA
jgi:hypothetical protein